MGCVESADSASSRRRRDDAAPTDPRSDVSEAPCAAASNPLVVPPPGVSGGETGPRDEAGPSSPLVFTPVTGPGQPFSSDQPQIEVGEAGDADDGGRDDVDYAKHQTSRGGGGSMDGGSTSSSRRHMSRRSSQLLLLDSSARMSGRSASMQGSPGTSTVAATLQRLHEQVARGSTDSGADPVLNWMQNLADRSLDSTATSLRGAFHFASSMSLAGSVSGGRSSSVGSSLMMMRSGRSSFQGSLASPREHLSTGGLCAPAAVAAEPGAWSPSQAGCVSLDESGRRLEHVDTMSPTDLAMVHAQRIV